MKKTLSILIALMLMCAMSVSAFAVEQVASIEVKPAPELVEETDDKGNKYVATVGEDAKPDEAEHVQKYDKDGATDTIEFLLLSLAEKDKAPLQQIKDDLTNADGQLQKAESVDALTPGLGNEVQKKLDDFKTETGKTVKLEDLIFSDVFSASMIKNKSILEQIEDGDKCIFKIKTNLKSNDCVILLQSGDQANWSVVDGIDWSEEGYLKITADRLSVFALVVEKNAVLPVNPDDPGSHQTGLGIGVKIEYAVIAVAFVGIAAYFVVKSKKKASN